MYPQQEKDGTCRLFSCIHPCNANTMIARCPVRKVVLCLLGSTHSTHGVAVAATAVGKPVIVIRTENRMESIGGIRTLRARPYAAPTAPFDNIPIARTMPCGGQEQSVPVGSGKQPPVNTIDLRPQPSAIFA